MAYSAEISRTNPSCFLFLIDQSASMGEGFGAADETAKTKADALADAINKCLQNLVIRCAKEEGIRDYYEVGVIGYGQEVGPAFGGQFAGRDLVPISEIGDNPVEVQERTKKVEDGAGGIIEEPVKLPVWFYPKAENGTPMSTALEQAYQSIGNWLETGRHQQAFPPVVINITDGAATDGDPSGPAARLSSLSTSDGNTLLFNVHLSSAQAAPIEFPGAESSPPDDFARLLLGMSSDLPPHMVDAARQEGRNLEVGAKGFVFNAGITSVIGFLDIGTRPSNLR